MYLFEKAYIAEPKANAKVKIAAMQYDKYVFVGGFMLIKSKYVGR